MGMIESIATASTNISMANARQDVSLKVLKNAMNQSEENMLKLMEMANVSPAPSGTTVDFIV